MGEQSQPFAGELFLALASEGRLVIDAARADDAIAGLERTLNELTSRLQLLRMWERTPEPTVDGLPDDIVLDVVDAVFAEQLAPGQLERAVLELPKYIQALHLARRPTS
ncbi:hypothetical protein [Mangrovihabitans endophyticus]|uniref:Uncharacterized protein n=1 Tax=Mangrovihabitans endophyticus TaxID=1751298 RepID=A0A8J3FQ54_9ACTN|nr:hypothetical protein [Mangrovihabitans endophyticus]GGK98131.1 hypothetical protein GCM10012284_35480 [Mangrovihabitans endophyticus]